LGEDLDDPEIIIRFQSFLFSLFQMVQTGTTADPAAYPEDLFSGGTTTTVTKTTTPI
jgi:hypothetical protein